MNDAAARAVTRLDGSKVVGPSYKGAYGTMRELDVKRRSGSSVDENYLRESILVSKGEGRRGLSAGDAKLQGAAQRGRHLLFG